MGSGEFSIYSTIISNLARIKSYGPAWDLEYRMPRLKKILVCLEKRGASYQSWIKGSPDEPRCIPQLMTREVVRSQRT